MTEHLTAEDIDLLVDCLDYRIRAIQENPYENEEREGREKEYRRRQGQVQVVTLLKTKLRGLKRS
jgi:hypothetical protein